MTEQLQAKIDELEVSAIARIRETLDSGLDKRAKLLTIEGAASKCQVEIRYITRQSASQST